MSELKLPRLLAAAKEFNVGQDTIIDFLVKKGFPKDDLKPTAKLTEDQYYSLQAEFQSDKVARDKADHVELPKNAVSDKVKKPEAAKAVEIVEKAAEPKPAAPKVVEASAKVKADDVFPEPTKAESKVEKAPKPKAKPTVAGTPKVSDKG